MQQDHKQLLLLKGGLLCMYSFVSYSYMETKIIERRKKWKEKGKSSIARMVYCATATSSMGAKHSIRVAVDRMCTIWNTMGKQSSACATRVVRIFTKLSQSISPKSLTKAYGNNGRGLQRCGLLFYSLCKQK